MRPLLMTLLFALNSMLTLFAQTDSAMIAAGAELYKKGEYESSLPVFEKCLATAKRANDKASQVILYDYIGHVYGQTGKIADAFQSYHQSAALSEETGNMAASARALINIGALYEEQKDYKKALENYSKSEAIGSSIHNSSIIADCANNKGVIYEQYLKKYPEAIKEYNKALVIYTKLKDQQRLAMTYNNLGIVYKYLGSYAKAISYYKKSLLVGESTGDQFLIAANMTNIGNVYAMLKEYPRAIEYNTRGLDIALKIKAINVAVEAAGSLAEDYAGMKNYEEAFLWHKKYSAYTDSLFNSERLQQIGELESKYQTAKKEKEITQLKEQQLTNELNLSTQKILLQKRNYQFGGIGGIVFMFGVVTFLLYNRQQLKQKQQREKSILLAEFKERRRISREMHDDIGAGLTQITLMSEHARLNNQPTYVNDLAAIATTSRKLINNMSEIVWSLNPENKSLDLLLAYLREQLNKLLEYSDIDFTISFPEIHSDVILSNEQKRNILLTTKEIVHNAVKYSKAKNITVTASLNSGILVFDIADDGCGFDATASFSGNGMKNIKQRIQEIGGELHIQSTVGTSTAFSYSIPLSLTTLTKLSFT
ncbi:MAG: tetratricopeptide repeat protein [Ferruginibacter sp.]|nr:tetratricopeptide repeat protein [Ferruginibacter sp.]